MFKPINRFLNLNVNKETSFIIRSTEKCSFNRQMKLCTDTQKCDADNRALSVSLRKNDKFSATMKGPSSSAVHRIIIMIYGFLLLRNVKILGLNFHHVQSVR